MNTKGFTFTTLLAILATAAPITAATNNPEDPNMENANANTLLQRVDYPDFKKIDSNQFEPAIDQSMAHFKQTIEQVLKNPTPTWSDTVQPLEEESEAIERVWNVISHLNSVKNTDNIRKAFEVVLAKITDFYTEIMQDERIYNVYNQIKASAEFPKLTKAQQTVIENTIRDFKLAGVTLPSAGRERYKAIQQRLSELNNQFSNNVLDASQGWNYLITADNKYKLVGLPEHTVALAKQKAQQSNQDGWLLTLDYPCYNAVLTYAKDADLRKIFYEAYSTRASDQGPLAGKWDNSKIMTEILQLRSEQAKLVGYPNYAEYSLATKMAKSQQQVIHFLDDLVARSRPQAEAEFEELSAFAQHKFNDIDVQPWDISYYAELYKQELFNISTEQLRPYFPEQKVLTGLFNLANKLFGITIEPVTDVPTWDSQVRVFAVKDQTGNTRGIFYADLYAREYKNSGAWMADLLSRIRYNDGKVQTPVAFLVANFTPPVDGKPALLSHDEIITLFHEFGHTLHHILTKVDYFSVSGTKAVAWDAIELPSQFMENWCWEWEVVKDLSEHYQTKEPLPKADFDKLYAAKNFQAALAMLRQIQLAMFDFRLHLAAGGDRDKSIQQLLDEVRAKTSVIKVPTYNRFQNSFSHIFSGGYAAGYYSYLWAEVLSSDAFEKFKENGTFNAQIGSEFLHKILEQGGSRDAMELFVDFRGREPTIDALLKHSGIMPKA